jgi:hypothetical protein
MNVAKTSAHHKKHKPDYKIYIARFKVSTAATVQNEVF